MTTVQDSARWAVPGDLTVPGHDDARVLVLGRIDPLVFDALVHEHPAADDTAGGFVDVAAMTPALLAAAVTQPVLTEEQAAELDDDWPAGEVEDLLNHVFALVSAGSIDRAWWRLERDDALRIEMDVCTSLGVSHSHFLGGPPCFTQQDRDLAVAQELRRLATCPGCGTRDDEWKRDPDAYIPDAIGRDKGCEVKALTEAQLTPEDREAGVHVILEPRAVVEAREAAEEQRAGDG